LAYDRVLAAVVKAIAGELTMPERGAALRVLLGETSALFRRRCVPGILEALLTLEGGQAIDATEPRDEFGIEVV
jgi:hypothetical protein